MPLREFQDADGAAWAVWEVQPQGSHRPRSDRRVRPDDVGARHRSDERLPGAYAGGWLAFRRGEEETRRLAPVPPRWTEAPVAELRTWLDHATVAPRRLAVIRRDHGPAEPSSTPPGA